MQVNIDSGGAIISIPGRPDYIDWQNALIEFVQWIANFEETWAGAIAADGEYADQFNLETLDSWGDEIQVQIEMALRATSDLARAAAFEAITEAVASLELEDYTAFFTADENPADVGVECFEADTDGDGEQEETIFHMEFRP